jgi:outer membrane protein TolC
MSGCMVGPRYVKPTVPVTPNFEETDALKEGDGWKVARPDDDLIRGKWWELYGDATLNEIEDQMDSSNQELKIAEANLRQARAAIRFNRASQAPTIGSSPNISDIRTSANKPYFPPSLDNNGSGDFVLPLDLSYEVDLWGRGAATCPHRCAASNKQADIPSPPIEALASIWRLSSRQPLRGPCPQPEKS